MPDALHILNASSSILTFSVFRDSNPPELLLRGQLESLLTAPRFVARDAHGSVADEHAWSASSTLGHSGAIEFLFDWGHCGKLGEHASSIRARVCRVANWLGLDLGERSNEHGGPRVSRSTSRVSAWVIPTTEELMIAQHTQNLLKPRQS